MHAMQIVTMLGACLGTTVWKCYHGPFRQLYMHAMQIVIMFGAGTTVWNGHQAQLTPEDDR